MTQHSLKHIGKLRVRLHDKLNKSSFDYEKFIQFAKDHHKRFNITITNDDILIHERYLNIFINEYNYITNSEK